jgi:hypothetical protein
MSSNVKLRVGSLNAAGELTAGSMARAIDDAMAALVKPGANEDLRGRRKLALAIAQGVIDHLVANAQAIMVTVPNTGAGSSTHEQPATQIDKW